MTLDEPNPHSSSNAAQQQQLATEIIETVAELLLVAEADAIVHGVSGYATVAVWMCHECLFHTLVELKSERGH